MHTLIIYEWYLIRRSYSEDWNAQYTTEFLININYTKNNCTYI